MAVFERDVIVAGAGPAGAICASYLAKAGLDVLLLDKDIFPRNRVCGDMLQESFVSHLENLEAVARLDYISTCIRSLKLMSSGGQSAIVPFECYTTSRYDLDRLLVDTAVSWGAEFRQGCRVVDVVTERGMVKGVKTKFRGEESEVRSKLLIGADGADSIVAKSLGIMTEAADGVWLGQRAYFKGVKLDRALAKDQYDGYGIFCFDEKPAPGYFWILPVGREGVSQGICNVGMMVHGRDSYKGRSLEDRFSAWLSGREDLKTMFDQADQISEWAGGKLPDSTQRRHLAGEGYMLIGDAASLTIPLFNDGLSAAADSAKAAADAAVVAFRKNDFSAKLVSGAYETVLGSQEKARLPERLAGSADPTGDAVKLNTLLIQSLHDPRVMDQIVERLSRDQAYRKRVMGR